MTSFIKPLAYTLIISISSFSLLANSTGLKVNASELYVIEMEPETAVDDVQFSAVETVKYIRLATSDFHPDSLDVEEEIASGDVQFSSEEVKNYKRKSFEQRVQQLIPVAQETEEGVNDIYFIASEGKASGR